VTVYVDSSGFLAVLLAEPRSDVVRDHLLTDPDWISARHSLVEVRRNIARLLPPDRAEQARTVFAGHWARTTIVDLDSDTCDLAAELAERTGVRTFDALHLAAAQRGGGGGIAMLTLDRRLADAARSIEMAVIDLESLSGGAS
jgi:predicted nucleic acid-binding protein